MSDGRDGKNGRFTAGNRGRPVGTRNRLQADLVKALADDFKAHGADTIRIVRAEEPATYLKIIVSVLPKEFLFTENQFTGVPDEDLEAVITLIERRLRGEDEDGEETTAH